MSQAVNLGGRVLAAYAEVRPFLPQALSVFGLTTLGALLAGPIGAPIGSVIGLLFNRWVGLIVTGLLSALLAYRNNPNVRQLVQIILNYLREKFGITYVRNQELFYAN